MKKLILLLTLVAVSFSADKWEYIVMNYDPNGGEFFEIGADSSKYGFKMKDENEQGYYVTIHEHKDSIVKPDYSVIYKEDKWIVYPWETEDSEEIQDYLNEK